MNITKPITEEEMIGEFLKAELHSTRFRPGSLKALTMLGFTETLIENPDYTDKLQNHQRAKTLGLCRGWPDSGLFTDFPKDTKWFLGTISQEELSHSYRLKSSKGMTVKERLLSETVQRLKAGVAVKNIDHELIKQIVAKIKDDKQLPPIILVGCNLADKKVLIEGHSRSTAYVYVNKEYILEEIPAIIGISTSMSNWAYF